MPPRALSWFDRIPATFVRFFLVGVLGFFADASILYLAIHVLGLGPISARLLSFLGAATFTWALNRGFTFGASDSHPLKEWARFLGANALGQSVNLGVYAVVIWMLGNGFWVPLIGAAAGSLAGLVVNYTLSRRLVFRRAA